LKFTRRRIAIGVAAAAAALAVAVPVAIGGITVFPGSLSPGDTPQTDRLFRDGVPSVCLWNGVNVIGPPGVPFGVPIPGPSKPNPGLFGDAGARVADTYTFWNASVRPQCVTVTLRHQCGSLIDPLGVNAFAAMYARYEPTDPSLNWFADAGQSGTPERFGLVVPALRTFQVVVSTVDLDLLNCNAYPLTVQIGKTATLTTAGGAGPTATGAAAAAKPVWKPGAVDKR
jgi:hypothetical protein